MLSPICPISRHARMHPDAVAVEEAGRRYSFAEYEESIQRTMAGLEISPGDRVGLCAPRSYAYLCLLQALFRLEASAVPISTRLPTVAVGARVEQLALRTCFAPPLPDVAAVAGSRVSSSSDCVLVPEAPAVVLLTSGSSATPKAVVHSHGSLTHNALGANQNMPIVPGDRWLLSLPLYHVSGLGIVFRTALAGATVVLDNEIGIAAAIRAHDITHVSVVGTQLEALVSAWTTEGALPSLKGVLVGGSSISERLIATALDLGIPLHTTYGSTEMGSQITTTARVDPPEKLKTAGRLLPYREAAISRDGEILVRGKTLCMGYLHGDGIQPCVDGHGWFHSGDNGVFDADGYLSVSGRRDTMFVSGGENIYPEELEKLLCSLETVSQAVVVAIPCETYGARPVAFAKASRHHIVSPEQIRETLRSLLPGYKVPDAILDWPEDYPDGGIKVDRAFLRDRALRLLG